MGSEAGPLSLGRLALLGFECSSRVKGELPFLEIVSPWPCGIVGMEVIPIPTERPGDRMVLIVLVLANPPVALNHPDPVLEGGAEEGALGLPDMGTPSGV